MKEKILAVLMLFAVLCFVAVNTIALDRQISSLMEMLNGSSLDEEKAENIYKIFRQKKSYMSLTVSHEDLTSIEECFIELIGYTRDEDDGNAQTAKNRLVFYLEHLRRLSGFNLDSII